MGDYLVFGRREYPARCENGVFKHAVLYSCPECSDSYIKYIDRNLSFAPSGLCCSKEMKKDIIIAMEEHRPPGVKSSFPRIVE